VTKISHFKVYMREYQTLVPTYSMQYPCQLSYAHGEKLNMILLRC
jgi:hypothetical protein